MAILFNTSNSWLIRTTGSFVTLAGDWSVFLYVFYTGASISVRYAHEFATVVAGGGTDHDYPYTFLGSSTPATDLHLDTKVLHSAGFTDANGYSSIGCSRILSDFWYPIAARHRSSDQYVDFYVGNIKCGSSTISFPGDAVVADFVARIVDPGGPFTPSPIAVAYYRAWNAFISVPDIKNEATSPTAVRGLNLLWDRPLSGPSDLSDISGHQPDMTVVGSASSTTGPTFPPPSFPNSRCPDASTGGGSGGVNTSIPRADCLPTTIVNSPARSSGCNQGGVGWTSEYTLPDSGSMAIGANPTDGELLTGKRVAHLWAEVQHVDY